MSQKNSELVPQQILDLLTTHRRFVLASHARPDGDSIGSQLALAFALRHLGKEVRAVSHDPPPSYLRTFDGIDTLDITSAVDTPFDAAVILECGTLQRTEVNGLDQGLVVNIDHHLGNRMYGAINWIDESAAAVGEMVFDLIKSLKVPVSKEMASFIYVAILTDTGSFQHSNITPRTFEACTQLAGKGIVPTEIAANVYQDSSTGKLRLTGKLLDRMQFEGDGRVAVLCIDDEMLRETGCAADDMEGLINLPLTAHDVHAVILFKSIDGQLRVSLRSKGEIDVRSVATGHGGGGHRNASGFSLSIPLNKARSRIIAEVTAAVNVSVHMPHIGG